VLVDSKETVRFMTNLCVGHYTDFQELLREQPMHAEYAYDLIGAGITMLSELTESQLTVEQSSLEEIELIQLLLWFLTVVMMGPRPANQLKVSRSDVVVALNVIIPAKSEVEKEMQDADPKFVNMQTLSFKVILY